GMNAIEHLFSVGAGLDSQILGDYEIVGQIKNAVKFSRQNNFIGSFLERLVNSVLQSSKNVKNLTEISGGTVSVSFAAVQYIRERVKDIKSKKILLIGVGKIGRNTCKNLVDYLDTTNIILVNRTPEKAAQLAEELGLQYSPYSKIAHQIHEADIILVATNATQPTVLCSDIEGRGNKLIIDLSIPYNVESTAAELQGVTVVNVDDLSKLKDETLQRREAEVPKAKLIIREHIEEFIEWHEHRKHVPVLLAVKNTLQSIHENPVYTNFFSCQSAPMIISADQNKIQKVINGMAVKLRKKNERGCHFIEAINEYMTVAVN
ncbi:MAG: glutamyl-tRNA reductase, partial [Flavitalea sp.]